MILPKIAKIFLAVIFTACIIVPFHSTPVMAGQNPSPEEISRIFDRVAQEKKVPAEILKAIAFHESHWQQWYSDGRPVIGNGGYIGIMQVSTPRDPVTADRLKNDIAFNIAYGADMLISKLNWNVTPQIGDGDPSKIENWYFAIWAYHRWDYYNNPHVAAANGRIPFQYEIFRIMNTEYMKGVIKPVKVTPLPTSQMPASGVPSKNSTWDTPQPCHYAAFSMGTPILSRSMEDGMLTGVPRIYGADRIDTALKIAENGWPHGCETVIIARSDDFSDALAGVALAKENNAPILLNGRDELDSRVKESLLTLKPLKVIILGGENAISERVEESIRETVYWTDDFKRFAGNNRYETAAMIASLFPSESGVAVANGKAIPDAISLASAAASKGYPLLLVGQDNLPPATENALTQLSPVAVYIGGGEKVISQQLTDKIKQVTALNDDKIQITGDPDGQLSDDNSWELLEPGVQRLAGKDRYETSFNILTTFFPQIEKLYVVNGTAYPDALTGAALAAVQNSTLLYIPPLGPTVGSGTEKYLRSLANTNDAEIQLIVIGSEEAISDQSILKMRYELDKKE